MVQGADDVDQPLEGIAGMVRDRFALLEDDVLEDPDIRCLALGRSSVHTQAIAVGGNLLAGAEEVGAVEAFVEFARAVFVEVEDADRIVHPSSGF